MSDLSIATESLYKASYTNEVMLQKPLLAMFTENRRVTWKGGVSITHPVVKATAASLLQMYSTNDELNVSSKQFLDNPAFNWKYGQLPLRYGCDVETQNQLATSEVKRVELVSMLTQLAQEGVRDGLDAQLHATTAAGDSGDDFQGVPEACDHSRTYGGKLSDTTFSVMAWWGGASLGDTYTDRATSTALSLQNIRRMKSRVGRYVKANSRLYMFLAEDMHSKLLGLCEGSVYYKGEGSLLKYGFDSFTVYGIEVVKDSYMTLNSMTDDLLLVNPSTWEFRIHPNRNFVMTPFVNQSQIAGHRDEMVARLKFAGNCICWQPNGNMWLSAIT